MGKFGNSNKIIDAEQEQSNTIKRIGICSVCNTKVESNMLKKDDKDRYEFGNLIDCPICVCHEIVMVKQ